MGTPCAQRLLRISLFTFALVALVWLLLARALPAAAGGSVTECSDDVQFTQRLAGGGSVMFNCGNATITLTSTKTITQNTTIDGGNVIALSGGGVRRLFVVNPGAALTLTQIVIRDGSTPGNNGGAVYVDIGGALTVLSSQFFSNTTGAPWSGGAIESFGTLTIRDSEFAFNSAGNGGVLFPREKTSLTTISASNFHDNHTTNTTNGWGGAMLLWNGAQLNIDSTRFVGNVAKTGGAVYLTSVSVLTLTNSSLSANSTSSDGGALYNAGTASLDDVMLQDNHSDFGGAIENGGTLSVARSTLYGNTGIGDGGAIENIGALALTNSMLLGNSTGDDGAGLNNPGTATVSGSTFSGNWSLTGVGGAIRNDGMAAIINSTLRGNSAPQGGGLGNYGSATLTNVTLSGNSAPQGGGIWHRGSLVTSTLNLKNTIVANSPSGGNCYKYPDSTTPITSLGYNLSGDDSCNGYFTQGTDWNTANPNLGPLANNGGPTLTQIPFPLPFPGNKAIDGGNGCPPTDQRGISRPQGGACDIGAVEYVSGEKSPWLYLPLIVR